MLRTTHSLPYSRKVNNYKFPFWLSQGINFVLLNCKLWLFLGQMTLFQIESQLFLDHISDGYVTDDFSTAGVVSGTVTTPSLVNVHVAYIYP